MMKKMKRAMVQLLALTMLASSLVACGGGGETSSTDATKSTLNVGVFDAGLGTTFFNVMAADFEEYYKETSFEDNKKGVQVVMDAKKDEFKVGNLSNTMPNYENALYFMDAASYTTYSNKGLLADITSVVTEKIYDENGDMATDTGLSATQSIEDTMLDDFVNYYKTEDSKYYAIPFYIGVSGIIYDADLFDEKGFFMYENGSFGATYDDIASGNCSKGPDGRIGTEDDGLPNTWNDFVNLMKEMRESSVIPFTWDGANTYQKNNVFEYIWANYEGKDNYMLNYTFSGHDTGLNVDITEENYKELVNQEGRKAAIKAFYDIYSNTKNYSANALTQSHTEAQFEYVWSSTNTNQPIAMFMEGAYWENEARSVFEEMAITDASLGYGKRNFKLMSVPKFEGVEGVKDQTNSDMVLPASGSKTFICISEKNKCKNPEVQLKLAKLFIQFVQTRGQMAKFTASVGGCTRPYDYKVEEAEYNTYTQYGKSIMKYREEGAYLTTDLPLAALRKANQFLFEDGNGGWAFEARKGTDEKLYDPFSYFVKYKGATVEDCWADFKATFAGDFNVKK